MATLVHLPYSPWSEKARWALDHHRIDHRRIAYLAMLGEPWLRLRLGKLVDKVSVPVLFGESWALTDSYDIAHWADRAGSGPSLFPRGHEHEIRRWNERSETLMSAGRARTAVRVAGDPEALREAVPDPLGRLGALSVPIARLGYRFLTWKYGLDHSSAEQHVAAMQSVLDELERALRAGRYLVAGTFSFADIAMAASLQFVAPVDSRHLPLGPASRVRWTDPELARGYADCLAWRDALYAEHRDRD